MPRQTKGRLYKAGKKEVYHLQYYVNKKQIVVTLKDDNGDAITREDLAKVAAEKILHPVKAANRAEQIRQVREAVEAAEDKAARLTAEAEAEKAAALELAKDRRATLADGWTLFLSCPKRPASCKRFPADDIPKHTTAANYRSYYGRFTEWIKAHRSKITLLSEVTPDTAAAFMESIERSSASGTFNKYLQFFTCFYETLSKAGKIRPCNPFSDIDRAQAHYNSKKPLSLEQIKILIQSATGEMKVLLMLGYFTGLRLGDCCTLEWREVDLHREVIERIPRKTEHTVKDRAQALVKVGIPPHLFAALAELAPSARRFVLPKLAAEYLAGRDKEISNRISRFFKSCGIETHRAGTGRQPVIDPDTGEPVLNAKTGKPKMTGTRAVVEIGFHSLRYSYISHNAEAGTPAAIIQKNAGHSNPAMTEHYTRISDAAAVKFANVLSLPIETTAQEVTDDPGDLDRAKLRALADTLPLETVQAILKGLEK